MVPEQLGPDDTVQLKAVLALIRRSFAYMDGRIDPPSSQHQLTLDVVQDWARAGQLWAIGAPAVACAVFQVNDDALYIGKLAVDTGQRGRGLARLLLEEAAVQARLLGLPALELHTRIELTENQAAFARMGFAITDRLAHEGYDRPTYVVMRHDIP